MEIVCIRNVLTVTSRIRFALLIRNTRLATFIYVAQAPLPLENLSSEGKKITAVSTKVEKSEDAERTHITPEKKQEVEAQAPPMNDAERMELTSDQKATKLPLEPGKASPFQHCDGKKVVSERILRLANEIVSLAIFEVIDLNSTLKRKLNLPDAPVFAQSFVALGSTSAAEEEAKSEKPQSSQKTFFSVKLTKMDDSKKIPLIKEVRAIVEGFNLVQAKKFVEALPTTVKEDLSKNEADELKAKLEKLGATCEIV
uniref:Large ribosomal subunit protein bL12 C-terminal domain-containing protein n=1 Tax=Wuchereria bancrofti TaxID=6293 RepID=A0AAF5Q598_WUCBA